MNPTDLTAARRMLRDVRPATPSELYGYVRGVLGYEAPRRARTPGMTAPFEYLAHAFFEDRHPRDCVVWANRGGGKTLLGAIATTLDLVFKPGIQVRILGGSLDQSAKMYAYLREMLERDELRDLIDGRVTGRRIRLLNGSDVEILSQSERSVRGQHVHKLRCDEIELFTDDVWQAAQYVTQSAWLGGQYVRGSIEILSTMHRPFGLMNRLVSEGDKRRQFRWGVIDVLEHCPEWRACESCSLFDDCAGAAKEDSRGHFRIDDAIQQQARSSSAAWRSEMLCERPSRTDCVYPEFDRDAHVKKFDRASANNDRAWVAGMDFGIRSPCVFLWAYVSDGVVWVVDEHIERDLTLDEHLSRIEARGWPRPRWIGADPAGSQRNEHTGVSNITAMRRAGFDVRYRRVKLKDGIEAVRSFIRSADGAHRLRIDPRCRRLIEALSMYHYDTSRPDVEEPVKDGPDHACDALRYLIVNYDRPCHGASVRGY